MSRDRHLVAAESSTPSSQAGRDHHLVPADPSSPSSQAGQHPHDPAVPYRDIDATDSSVPADTTLGGSPVHISRETSPLPRLSSLSDPLADYPRAPQSPSSHRKHGFLSTGKIRGVEGGGTPAGHGNEVEEVRGWEDTFEDEDEEDDDDDYDDDDDNNNSNNMSGRPPVRLGSGRSRTPLLSKDKPQEDYSQNNTTSRPLSFPPSSPPLPTPLLRSRRSTSRFHERQDPALEAAAKANRKRYTYAAFFLVLSLVSFTVQTETAVYIQHHLHWNKAYCMLYLTHGSWSLLWPVQLLILRLQKWKMPWPTFWRRHVHILRSTALMVQHGSLHLSPTLSQRSPAPYFLRTTALVTCALTVAGGSWYIAVDLTTPSDLTAIYNCSAFFAYAFAIPLLGERLRWSKVTAVLIAVAGVLVVAYGDGMVVAKHGSKSGGGAGGGSTLAPSSSSATARDQEASNRALGNMVIGLGSVLYGFYEVLYKKVACPPDRCSPGRGIIFANTFGSMIGAFTLTVLWLPLPLLHWLGWETFELPSGEAAWMLGLSVLANAVFSGSFLVLISLTSPVLSSVAALLTIFIVAVADQVLPPPLHNRLGLAAVVGGLLIVVAFALLSWATYREMLVERRLRAARDELEVGDEELEADDEHDGRGA